MTSRLPQRAVAALLVPLLLVAALFAGRTGAAAPDPALATFLALGGHLSDICGGGGQPHAGPHCDACAPAPAVLPTPPATSQPLRLAALAADATTPGAASPARHRRPWTPRAPPAAAT